MANQQPLSVVSVAVFIDASNVYHGARGTFHEKGDPGIAGRTWPHLIGEWLCDLSVAEQSTSPRYLHSVRVHEGLPSRNDSGHNAALQRHEQWTQAGAQVFPRLLEQPAGPTERQQESGVDVALALDCLHLALAGSIDVAIIFAEDRDYEPLIEHLLDLECTVEVAHWWNNVRDPNGKQGGFLAQGRRGVAHRFLDADTYEDVRIRPQTALSHALDQARRNR